MVSFSLLSLSLSLLPLIETPLLSLLSTLGIGQPLALLLKQVRLIAQLDSTSLN